MFDRLDADVKKEYFFNFSSEFMVLVILSGMNAFTVEVRTDCYLSH